MRNLNFQLIFYKRFITNKIILKLLSCLLLKLTTNKYLIALFIIILNSYNLKYINFSIKFALKLLLKNLLIFVKW